MRSLAMSIYIYIYFFFFYACETWTITADIERRIQTLEMRCFRKLLGISYRDYITNEEVKAKTGNAIGQYEDLLTSVKHGTVQEGRQKGRQRKRWEDNIKEWTGLEWNILLRKAMNR